MRRTTVFVSALLATALGVLAAPQASAEPLLPLHWSITGETVIAKPGLTVPIPAGATFTGNLDLATWTMVGDTAIPDLTVHMTLLGFIPTTSVVRMVPTERTTGTVDLGANKVEATTKFRMQVLRVSSDWLPSVNLVPRGCRTAKPSVARLHNTTPVDLNRMTMAGTFAISGFTGCGLATPLLTALLSGSGNRMTLHFGPPSGAL